MNIQHNEHTKRFYIAFDGGADAELKYRVMSDDSVDFYSTFVPNAHRGKGLATQLVKRAVAWAEKQGYAKHASCLYARKHLN